MRCHYRRRDQLRRCDAGRERFWLHAVSERSADRHKRDPLSLTLSGLSIRSLTLAPSFDPQINSYEASYDLPDNSVDALNILLGTREGQSVSYALGENTTSGFGAGFETVGSVEAISIGTGNLTVGDTGTIEVLLTVSHNGTVATSTYKVTIHVTVVAGEIVDV